MNRRDLVGDFLPFFPNALPLFPAVFAVLEPLSGERAPAFSSVIAGPSFVVRHSVRSKPKHPVIVPGGVPGCDETDNSECTCTSNRACMKLQRYLTVPAYLREALSAYQLGEPEQRGVWD